MTPQRVVTVTRRQRAVIGELTRDGASNRQIAQRLHVTEDTVKTHIKHVLTATGCTNRTELVVALLRSRVRLRTVSTRRWPANDESLIPAA